MNLSRCNQGHFYDKEKYATCPHCNSGVGGEDGITMAFTEDLANDDIAPTQPLDEVTQPIQASASQPNTPSVRQPAESVLTPPAAPPIESSIPVPPSVGSIPVPPSVAPPPTVPPFSNGGAVEAAAGLDEDEDSDVTVGFFSSIFEVPESSKQGNSAVPPSKAASVKTLGSPCVGWLIAIAGNHVGEDFRLKAGKNFIGRDASMDVALTNDKSVSRNKHAIVTYEPKQHLYLVQPGESSELAYLNNEVVLTPVRIKAYDMITVGEVNLLFMPLCGERFDWTELPDPDDM